ncbi:histidine kinase [Actinoplanes friuliensis DSM 7358]|uniref:Sensor-like histidine kinase SenX3 n=1 Tax=Actinoplanes friuliensis DSM 7358 TaxID=1246995 RepID=U5W5A8_9ACTN|nr:histidine kinase [Actinoplanes friuliensis DSM 7358]
MPGAGGWAPGRWSVRVLALVIALGVLGTVLAAVALRRADDDRARRALGQQTMIVSQVVSAEVRRYSTSLTDLAAAVGAQANLEAAEYTAIAASVDRQRLPGASGVAFVVAATTDEMPAVQKSWRDRGDPQLTFTPSSAPTDEHFFVVLYRGVEGGPSPLGLDVADKPEAVEAMQRAKASHRVATSSTYRLLTDSELPVERQQLSFVLAAPVYSTSPSASDTGQFRGWLMMGLRGGDFLKQAIGVVARDTVAVTLYDTASTAGPTPVASWVPDARLQPEPPPRDITVSVPQRTWRLVVEPTHKLLPVGDMHLDVAAWIIGAVLTGLLAALTGTVITARNRALRKVDDATAALRDDIVRREAVEQQLRQREAELVGFAGIVAHDLRSPLARITGYADFLREEAAPRLDPLHRDFLERLYGGAQRMQTLIDDLLDYATAENRTLHTSRVDLRAMADDITRERLTGTEAHPPTIVIEDLPTVDGDPTLLCQVLDNLIGNALKYTAPGEEPYVRVSCRTTDGMARIEVADHGIGIPADQRDTVFTAFARAPGSAGYPGTGLGLAIVHRIVERHGGEVGVDANPGGGSLFWFTVPHAAALTPSVTAPSS